MIPSDYVVRSWEPGLWTVGILYTDEKGRERMDPASDHGSEAEAAVEADRLNGGTVAAGLAAAAIGDPDAYTGPDGVHVEVDPEHLAVVAKLLPRVHVSVGAVVAQLMADAQADGVRVGAVEGYADGRRDAEADAAGRAARARDNVGQWVLTREHLDDLRNAWNGMPYTDGLRPDRGPSALVAALEILRDRLAAVLVRDAEQLAELHRHRESLAALVDEPERDPGTVILTVEQWQAERRELAAKVWHEGSQAERGAALGDAAPRNPYVD